MLPLQEIREYLATQPVLRAWLFGSYSDKTANSNSDVDILVELDHSEPIGLKFVSMWLKLKEITQKEVDLLSLQGLSPKLRPYIEKQKVLIYERK
ncbi:nucleotidyltransferase family protein [Raineya sp.]|jgi:hypothetical protein